MTGAYQCDECKEYFNGGPLHSILLNATVRWADFDSFRCLVFWAVKHTDGTDLLDIKYLAHGTDDAGNWSRRAKPGGPAAEAHEGEPT